MAMATNAAAPLRVLNAVIAAQPDRITRAATDPVAPTVPLIGAKGRGIRIMSANDDIAEVPDFIDLTSCR